jgi:hypothetical protein
MIFSGIYKLTFPNGKIYIGQSVDILKRLCEHKRESIKIFNLSKDKRLKNITKLRGHFKKYKWNEIDKDIICLCPYETLNENEIYQISFYNSFSEGLNCTTGGDGNFTRSEETKNKMRVARKNKCGNSQSIPFFIDNIKYISVLDASLKLNIPHKTIHNRLNSGNPKFSNYVYENRNLLNDYKKRNDLPKVLIDGITYESYIHASKLLNISSSTVKKRCESKSKKFSNYSFI